MNDEIKINYRNPEPDKYYELLSLNKKFENESSKISAEESDKLKNNRADAQKKHNMMAIMILIIAIISGIFLGNKTLSYKVYGMHTLCYVTDYGDCYHAAGCQYLRLSQNKITVYEAKEEGYRPCSKCNIGKLDETIVNKKDTTLKQAYLKAICSISIVLYLLMLLVLHKIKKKQDEVIAHEKYNKEKNLKRKTLDLVDIIFSDVPIRKLALIPDDVIFDEENWQIRSVNEAYYRYIGWNGNCYHSNPNCGGHSLKKVWMMQVKGLSCCSKCGIKIPDKFPIWYVRLSKLKSIKKKIDALK